MSHLKGFQKKAGLGVMVVITNVVMLLGSQLAAQTKDSSLYFKAALSATQNGFSIIPSFSLGKPAIILEPSIGNKRMSFEPQFRFAMTGKPWSFIFIYRYKIIDRKKFSMQLGGHIPAINFNTQTATINGVSEEIMESKRFLAAELITNHVIADHVSMGLYLLRGHGYNNTGIKDSYYAGFRITFSQLNISKQLYVQLNPQLYYLRIDDKDGVFLTNTLNLRVRNFPFSFASIFNKAIRSTIVGKQFDWNLSLVYSFHQSYHKLAK